MTGATTGADRGGPKVRLLVGHPPEAPSASSASEQSGHSWRDGSTRSKYR
jgi:hypothetical protein